MAELMYIRVFLDWREATRKLTLAEKGRLIDAMIAYASNEPDAESILKGNETFVFPIFQLQIDRLREELEKKSRAQTDNGKLGGRPRKEDSNENPKKPSLYSETQKSNIKVKEEIKDEFKPDSYESGNNPPSSEILTLSLLLKDGTEYEITGEYERRMQTLFPSLDVLKEMQKMSAWCINNPAKRKTKTGITRFINSWLSTAQKELDEKGGGKSGQGRSSELPPSGSAKRFNVKYDVE